MLNPSTADASVDDPTIRRCVDFSRSWGFAELVVCNLYAYRATQTVDLFLAQEAGFDIVGPENREWMRNAMIDARAVVAAWGNGAAGDLALRTARETAQDLHCLGRTARGRPKHPLYVPKGTALSLYARAGEVVPPCA